MKNKLEIRSKKLSFRKSKIRSTLIDREHTLSLRRPEEWQISRKCLTGSLIKEYQLQIIKE
jgi:hypothetical protein